MRVIVTGANGFIGRAICDLLEKNSVEVIRFIGPRSESHIISKKENSFVVDISRKETLKVNCEDVNAIIHTAGLAHQFDKTSKEDFWKVNVEGTKNIAEYSLVKGIKHFIQISSVSVYGNIKAKESAIAIDETADCSPIDYYAKSKLEAEMVCREVFKNQQSNLTILRLVTVIGEEDTGNVFRLIKLLSSRKFIWVGKGFNSKSLIHKDDVAEAVNTLLENKKNKTEVFNVSAETKTMLEIVSNVSKRLNRKVLPFKIPAQAVIRLLSFTHKLSNLDKVSQIEKNIEKWIADDVYSSKKIFDEYDFKTKISIEKALNREVDWYLKLK